MLDTPATMIIDLRLLNIVLYILDLSCLFTYQLLYTLYIKDNPYLL